MKTIQEILDHYEDQWATSIDDRFGRRFTDLLTIEQIEATGWSLKDEFKETWKPKEWTRENILEQLKRDVAFGFEKALNRRGISSGMMFDVVLKWNRVLEEGLEDWDEDDYAQYGLPLFKATAVKYGWPNPIGDKTGSEFIFSDESDEWFGEEE